MEISSVQDDKYKKLSKFEGLKHAFMGTTILNI